MNYSNGLLGMIALSIALGACGGPESANEPQGSAPAVSVVGSISYRERIALPPDSVATIYVNDVSRADAAAMTVAQQIIPLAGRQVPIPFELAVDRTSIEPRSRYAVRAVIRDRDEKLLWTTDTVYPLTVDADTSTVDLGMLRLVSASQDRSTAAADTSLSGPEWVVEDMNRAGIVDNSRATLVFGEDGTLSGRATCNSYTGSYSLNGNKLETGELAVTLRSCPEALARQEETFLRILREAESVSFDMTGALVLTSSAGETLLARPGQ